MHFYEYTKEVGITAVYPNRSNNVVYPTLGLTGEAGEVAEKVKKIIRDKDGIMDYEDRKSIAYELGDVLWYLSAIAHEIDFSLDTIAVMNITKLKDRQTRDKLHGSGDER